MILVRAILLLIVFALPASAGPSDSRSEAVELLDRGVTAFNAGALVDATKDWSEAARLCRIAGAPGLEAEALARRGEAYRVQGHFREARQDLTDALDKARTAHDPYLTAASSGALGNLAFLSHRTAEAEPLLLDTLAGAKRLNDMELAAVSSNDLGNVYVAINRPELAVKSYQDAKRYATAAGDGTLPAIAETNQARVALGAGEQAGAVALLQDAFDQLSHAGPDYRVALALIAIGSTALIEAKPAPAMQKIAARALERAEAIARKLNKPALESAALGESGHLALQTGNISAASRLTQEALLRARQASAPEMAFRWEWQQARIDRTFGHDTAALDEFRNAVATLESVRRDFPNDYQDGQSSFRQQFGGLYLEFIDLLLTQSRAGGNQSSAMIHEARAIAEELKATELQDYFRDPCITSFEARQRGIETVAPDTAVIYPIILPDRLELLLSVAGRDVQITVPISEPQLRAEVLGFRRLLERRSTNEFLVPAQQLYDLVMRPMDKELSAAGVQTLVIVPDGVLRSVPLSALYDGQHFLIERYAIATVPGLRLVDPKPLSPEARRMLAAGISKSREGFPALPNVASELDGISRLEHSTNLLDNAFLRQRFERELRDTDYTMVHLASHSQIGTDPSQSFVLAFDGQLNLDDLEDGIKVGRFRDLGLELLTLSACQTASGDDRAALGMAGLALKAGARSVLATLWVVNDQASGRLAVEFYRQLQNPSMSKAQALQAAQRSLIEDPLLGHPAYWAPFLLIGNWL